MIMDDMKNFAYGTVATAPSPSTSGVTLVLQTGQGATFPAAPFNATMWPPDVLPRIFNAEIGRCTDITGDTLTITRAQSGTTAQPIFAGYQVCQSIDVDLLVQVSESAAGPQGATGTQGAQGVTGTDGTQGVDGTQGATGADGTQGAQGVTGADGAQGATGADGAQGAQGATGVGTQGATGAGTQGSQGATGTQGSQGSTSGTQGSQGATGTQGATGAGTQGSQGATGTQGVQGATGTQGAQGAAASSSSVETLTNKRITRRVLALSANSATPAVNTDNYDVVHITAQTATITGFTMTGTPLDGDTLRISITGTAAVPFTLGSSFEAGAVALATTTVTTARLDMGFFWNTETSKWRQEA